jgi:hypothetical protein
VGPGAQGGGLGRRGHPRPRGDADPSLDQGRPRRVSRRPLPARLHEGIGNGALKGERIDPEQFLAARRLYYEMAGWDPDTGRPTAAKLAELGVATDAR